MMITAGSFHIALADPIHCDQAGYPSCYSVGYNDGQANPGTNCPSGHSDNFCAGWQAGSLSGNGTTAIVTAPPGSTIGNVTITRLPPYEPLKGTWNIINGSTPGTITFKETWHTYPMGLAKYPIDKFTATIGDRHFKGFYMWSPLQPSPYLQLCPHDSFYKRECTTMNATTVTQDHIELQDSHGDTIRLMRNG